MKRLGEAVDPAERELETVVRRVPGWAGSALAYRPVGGGITNSNWRVDTGGKSYFVKVPGRGTEMFIDRVVAMDASRKAHALGIGPATYDWLAADGVEIADFITDRRACGLGDFDDAVVCDSVIDAYRAFHAAPALGLTKTVFDMIDEHKLQVRDLGGWRPLDTAGLDARVAEARTAILAAGLDLVPCFNDPMPGNFLVGDDRSVLLIDYEYASNNDRAYDLGAWFGEMFFPPDKAARLVERYAGRPDPGLLARTITYQALADIKWATWSMVQERISAVDFDFRKYGVWKYMRARHIFDDARWPAWLNDISDGAVADDPRRGADLSKPAPI